MGGGSGVGLVQKGGFVVVLVLLALVQVEVLLVDQSLFEVLVHVPHAVVDEFVDFLGGDEGELGEGRGTSERTRLLMRETERA